MERKLYRSSEDRALLGICGGIGEYLDIDPIIIRLIVVILTLLGFSGLLFYIVAIFIIPESPQYRAVKNGTYQETTYEYKYGTPGDNGQPESAGYAGGSAGNDGAQTTGAPHYDYEVGPDGKVREAKKDLSDYGRERQKNRKGGNNAVILGLFLIAMGAFVLLKMFLPWIDTRLFLAIALIGVGILVIAKR